MDIVYFGPDELIEYATNPRKNDQAVESVAASIKQFGFLQPIVIDRDRVIVAGHTRCKAARKLNLAKVPCVIADTLTEEQIKAFRIIDNRTNEIAEWDIDLLKLELESIPDFDFEELKVDFEELTDLINPEAHEDDFEIPEESEIQTKIKPGDLITIGQHRLLCGDSTDAESVAYLMDGKKAEMLFTSPPYSDMRDYNGDKNLSVDHLSRFIPAYKNQCDYQVVNLGLQRKDNEIIPYWDDYIKAAKDCGLKLLAWNVWDKTQGGSIASATAMFLLTHEWIFVFGEKSKKLNRTVPNQLDKYAKRYGKDWQEGIEGKLVRQSDGSMLKTSSKTYTHHQIHSCIQQTPELSDARKKHPAMFPVGLPSEYIKAITNTGDIITDPFLGSGTTMVAAHQLNRICYGMELEPKYCQVIVDRMKALDPSLEITSTGEL